MRGKMILLGFLLIVFCAFVGLWRWPSYRQEQRVRSGVSAAELGAKMAFAENLYRERFGGFTPDFARLFAVLEESVPCPLEREDTVLACEGYQFHVEGNLLVLQWQEGYMTFGLADGRIDCTQAPASVKKAPLCSAFE